MISDASHITLRIVTGARFFASKKIYECRNVNLSKGMRFVAERGCCLTLDYALDERFVYGFELKNVRKKTPSMILSCRIIDFQIGELNSTILTPGNKVGCNFQNKTCFPCLKRRKRD